MSERVSEEYLGAKGRGVVEKKRGGYFFLGFLKKLGGNKQKTACFSRHFFESKGGFLLLGKCVSFYSFFFFKEDKKKLNTSFPPFFVFNPSF